jgi:hypothetical protein
MLFSCWSLKGGSGTTVVSVALADLLGRRHAGGAVVVDLAGDVPALFGHDDPDARGVADWLAAGDSVAPDGWSRLEVAVAPHLVVVPRGRGPLGPGPRTEVLAGLLGEGGRPVVVDCGMLDPVEATTDHGDPGHVLARAATTSWLVTRPCYLALRRCARLPLVPSGVVVLREPGRGRFVRDDVERAVGAPVVAEVPFDAAVARAVDDGVFGRTLPRGLVRALREAA